jgi:hypothetical protein
MVSFVLILFCISSINSFAFKYKNNVNYLRANRHRLIQEESKMKTKQKSLTEIQTSLSYVPSLRSRNQFSIKSSLGTAILNAMILTMTVFSQSAVDYTVPNHFINYGHFCGPGSPDAFGNVSPVDQLDSLCQGHDQRYKMCLTEFELPGIMAQAMAVRGYLPKPIDDVIPQTFGRCIHEADEYLVEGLTMLNEDNALPNWWDNPDQAPQGSEGVNGFHEACAVGVNDGKNGLCLISSKKMFYDLAVALFSTDLKVDELRL